MYSNEKYFDIERSANAINFSAVAQINGHGTSGIEHAYSFTDKDLTAGNYYYRLAQHDFDGNIHYSPIIRLTQKTKANLLVTPNPAASFINVISSGSLNGTAYIITSALGTTVKKGIVRTQQINVPELPPGQYWISIHDIKGTEIIASFAKK